MDMRDVSRSGGNGLIMRDRQQVVLGDLEYASQLVGNGIRVNVVRYLDECPFDLVGVSDNQNDCSICILPRPRFHAYHCRHPEELHRSLVMKSSEIGDETFTMETWRG